jgi:hypothetical protein
MSPRVCAGAHLISYLLSPVVGVSVWGGFFFRLDFFINERPAAFFTLSRASSAASPCATSLFSTSPAIIVYISSRSPVWVSRRVAHCFRPHAHGWACIQRKRRGENEAGGWPCPPAPSHSDAFMMMLEA